MKETQRKIDVRRRNLEDLIIQVLTRAKEAERDPRCDYGDRFVKCAEFLQTANNDLFMAIQALNGRIKNADD